MAARGREAGAGESQEALMRGSENVVQLAEAAGNIACDVEDENAVLAGHLLVKVVEAHRREAGEGGVVNGFDRGGPREGFEDAHFTEEIRRGEPGELGLLLGSATLPDPDRSGMNDKHAVARLAFAHGYAARPEIDGPRLACYRAGDECKFAAVSDGYTFVPVSDFPFASPSIGLTATTPKLEEKVPQVSRLLPSPVLPLSPRSC